MPHSLFGHKHNKKDAAKRASIPPVTSHSTPASIASSSESSNANNSTVRPRSRSYGSNHALFQTGPATSETSSNKSTATAKPNETAKKLPNVFEFLEDDNENEDNDTAGNAQLHGTRSARCFSEPVRTMSATQPTALSASPTMIPTPSASFHHDPGISRREISPDRASSVASKESTEFQPATPPDVSPAALHLKLAKGHLSNQKLRLAGAYSPIESQVGSPFPGEQTFDLSVPESYYVSPREKARQSEQPLTPSAQGTPDSKSKKAKKNTKASHVSSGYEYLASKLTPSRDGEKSLPPLYRKFESVNHRVLLHLQDEISQMEEDLHILDQYEEMHRLAAAKQEGTKPAPASRRMDAQAQSFSALHYRRMDLLGKLILKTEQYNNALCAYSKVVQTLSHASERDIETYHAWMKGNCPIAKPETRFLEHNLDLISLSPRPSVSIYSTMAVTSAAILLPLLAFGTISEFAGRLVVVAIVGGATTVFAANYSAGVEHLIDPQDGWRCAAIYFGSMAVAAIVIP